MVPAYCNCTRALTFANDNGKGENVIHTHTHTHTHRAEPSAEADTDTDTDTNTDIAKGRDRGSKDEWAKTGASDSAQGLLPGGGGGSKGEALYIHTLVHEMMRRPLEIYAGAVAAVQLVEGEGDREEEEEDIASLEFLEVKIQ